jgi:hypothetical protein
MYYLAVLNLTPFVTWPDNYPCLLSTDPSRDEVRDYSNRWPLQGYEPICFPSYKEASDYGTSLMNTAKEEQHYFIPQLAVVKITPNNMRKMTSAMLRWVREEKCLMTPKFLEYKAGKCEYNECIFRPEQYDEAQNGQ